MLLTNNCLQRDLHIHLPIKFRTSPMKSGKALQFAGLYRFLAYLIINAAVFADAPGWPIRSSNAS